MKLKKSLIPVYIEQIDLRSVFYILKQLEQVSKNQTQTLTLFYIGGTILGIRLMELYCHFRGWSIACLSFKLIDIREKESGDLIRLCIPYDYLWEIKKEIINNYPDWLPTEESQTGFRIFLEKSLIHEGLASQRSLSRTLYLIHVAKQHMDKENLQESVLMLLEQPWEQIMRNYAESFGIRIRYIKYRSPVKNTMIAFSSSLSHNTSWHALYAQWLRQILKINFPRGLRWIRGGRHLFSSKKGISPWKYWKLKVLPEGGGQHKKNSRLGQERSLTRKKAAIGFFPKLAVFPQGHWYFKNDGNNSDSFFAMQSSLPNQSILMLQQIFSKDSYQHLQSAGIQSCLMNHTPPNGFNIPFYLGPRNFKKSVVHSSSNLPKLEQQQKSFLRAEFEYTKSYWIDFFKQQDIKIFTTWFKMGPDHVPIADAIKETEGMMTVWQRSYEEVPNVVLNTYADVAFGYSPWLAETEKLQNSNIGYYVATGYLKDYCHALLKPSSMKLRQQLQNQGCKKIVSVFDENSVDDNRWHTGHELQRTHYRFWAEKVLQEPWLGVIFKPKVPSTLMSRLGDTAELIDEAKKTNRVIILDTSAEYNTAIPPVLAAMASDVSIHGHLCSGSTALDCILAGVPSLLIDYDGWKRSRLYQLGVGQVVFPDYESLWDVLQEHWNSPNAVPGFSDWSDLLPELDPFQDGRAAERMGNYLHWLLQGFERKLDRETILANAAERYCKQWGNDKIVTNI